MQITNRTLLLLLIGAVGLVMVAMWLTLTPMNWTKAPNSNADVNRAQADGGVPKVIRTEGAPWTPEGPATVTAAEGLVAKVDCDGLRKERILREGKGTFDALPSRGCALELLAAAPDNATAAPQTVQPFYPLYPGDNVICRVEGVDENAKVECDNSLAQAHAATLVVAAPVSGAVKVNGKHIGMVPIEGHRLAVGKHTVTLVTDHGEKQHPLTVRPDEFVRINFHAAVRDLPPATPKAPAAPPTP